ncbi:hypothetical protein PATY110618_13935 [Paenibacillus typhae]|uniref:Uncharacterized protein n=2 Tax=Paenibacillus typhae TaxID=1174501 RepID=A0A1G8UKJ4_9BACL|nr:hypothetical protein SAMN05216192_11921 [Paenibacillus typhae]
MIMGRAVYLLLLEVAGFMFFSTIEGLSLYYLIMCLFRFKWRGYLWPAMVVILLNNIQSYLLRNELNMDNLSPLITVIVFILLFAAVVRMPVVLAVMATVSGYVIFAAIQTALVFILFGSLEAVNADLPSGYLLQSATAAVVVTSFWFLYRKGRGFTFDLDKLRFRLEDIVLTVTIIVFLLAISVVLFYNNLLFNIAFFIVMSVFLLYYSTKKEQEDA